MSLKPFDIQLLSLNWVDNKDETRDYCAHGTVYVRIGEKVLENGKDEWTVSAMSLFLMRTLTADYEPGQFHGNFLVPCCGFMMWPGADGNTIDISGCNQGIDWTIKHESDMVKHIAQTGEQAIISLKEYKDMVFSFADNVEAFFNNSKTKLLPEGDFDTECYERFWKEWKRLRNAD